MLTTKSHAGNAPVRAAQHFAPQAGWRLSRLASALGLMVGLGAGGVVWGQTIVVWSGGPDPSYDGNWGIATDWVDRATPPAIFETARFDLNQTYSVSMVTNTVVKNIEVAAGDVRLDIFNNSEVTATTALKVNNATLRIANGKVITNLDATSGNGVIAGAATFTNAKVFLENGWLETGPTINTAPQPVTNDTTRPSDGKLWYSGTLLVEGHGHFIGNLAPNLSSYSLTDIPLDVTIRAVGGNLVLGNNTNDDWSLFGNIETGPNTVSITVLNDFSPITGGSNRVYGRVSLAGGTLESNHPLGLGGGFEGYGTLRATASIGGFSISGNSILTGDMLLDVAYGAYLYGKIEIGANRLTVRGWSQAQPGYGTLYLNNMAEIALAGGELAVNPVLYMSGNIGDTYPLTYARITGFGVVRGKTEAAYQDNRTGAGGALVVVYPAEWFVPTGALTLAQTLGVGSDEVRLLSTAPTVLNGGATMTGGTLYAPNGILLDGTNVVAGSGIVFGGATGTNAANGWVGSGALTLTSALNAGSGQVTLLAGSPVAVETKVTLGGGTLLAPSGLFLDSGGSLEGSGTVEAQVSGSGSIAPGGALNIGDSASTTGVAFAGTVTVGAHTLTLRDADAAALSSSVTLAGGELVAANGFDIAFGSTLSGYGTVTGAMGGSGAFTASGGGLTFGSATDDFILGAGGVLNVGAETVTLHNHTVVLGNSTILAGGQLNVDNGFTYDTSRKVSGYGLVFTNSGAGLELGMTDPTGALTLNSALAVGSRTLTFLSNADTVLNAELTFAAGRLNGSGFGLTIGSAGSLTGYGTITSGVANAGTLSVTAGNLLTISGAFANTGSVNPTGMLRLTGGGVLGGTFGSGALDLNGNSFTLPNDWTTPSGLTVTLGGSTITGPGALQVASGATLHVASGGGTVNTAVSNAGTVTLGGSLGGSGALTNQGTLQAEVTAPGFHAGVSNPLINASSGTVSVPLGRSLTLSGPVDNSGTLSVAGTPTLVSDLILTGTAINTGTLDVAGAMTFAGPVTNSGSATVSGQLYFNGGGTSTGAITLAGGLVGFGSTTFSVPNAATSITGPGALTFGGGTTTLDYGISNAPLTVTQSLAFTGGALALPGATSLRTNVLALANSGQTPDLPTTILAGGTFIWNSGSVRNTLTLEAGVKTTDTGFDTINLVDPSGLVAGIRFGGGHTIDGTLINRSSTLSFQSTVGGLGLGGSGTLRNEGTVSINTLASTWTPTVENVGTATLAGHFSTVNNAASLTIAASGVDAQITTLTQTAGSTTFSGFQHAGGQTWDIQAGSTLATPDGAWLTVGSLVNAGTLDFTGPTTVVNPMQNQAGGKVHITDDMQTISPFLTQNQGTIILDGPLAKLWILISGVLGGTSVLSSEQLATIGGGTLEIRNGANLTLSNGISGAASLIVGNGSTLAHTGGTLSGPGTLTIQTGGTMSINGGGIWGDRAISNAGTFNANGALNLPNNTAGTFANLAGGVINLNGGYQFINADPYYGRSVVLTNAAGATIRKIGGPDQYDLIFYNGTFENRGLVEVESGQGRLGLGNFTNYGRLLAAAGTEFWLKDGTFKTGSVLDGAGTYRMREGTTTLDTGLNFSAIDLWLNGGTITGPGNITVRNGDSFRHTDGTLNGPGTLTIETGGTMTINGGGTWGDRAISNAGTFNANGALNLPNNTAGTFANLAGGVINLNGGYQFINADPYYGRSVVLTNAAGATIRKIGGPDQYDLIYYNGTFVNHGTVEVNSGFLRTVVGLPGGQLTEGTWRVTDGARLILNDDAAITQNAATVVLTGAGSVFNGLNSLTTNAGSLSLLGGRAFTTSAAMTNSGTLAVGSGSSFSTSSTFANSGNLNVTGAFSAGGGLTNTGTLGGSGTFTGSLISAGTLSPGNSPGLLTVTGNLTLQGTSQLYMELGGLVEGVSYDSIDVSGIMALNGALNVVLVNGFVPATGATFNLFDASSFTGTFGSMSLPTLTNGLSWNSSALYTSGIIIVSGAAIPEPSTYAALAGLGALGLALWRRRGVLRSSSAG
ncbi:MAG: PEP-CTERM sorting domain-containing protein [Lacunisphaera sp.]|nr:PEP-CTERM sorting domain-containing protein [Lacunisphaera sp.]